MTYYWLHHFRHDAGLGPRWALVRYDTLEAAQADASWWYAETGRRPLAIIRGEEVPLGVPVEARP